jgi:hypothetical protein
MTVGSIALVGSLLPAHLVLGIIAGLLALRALIWHIRDSKRFALDRFQVQADRELAGSGWHGVAYFGRAARRSLWHRGRNWPGSGPFPGSLARSARPGPFEPGGRGRPVHNEADFRHVLPPAWRHRGAVRGRR